MAFRSQTRIGVMVLMTVLAASAAEFQVTHEHLRRDEPGVLRVEPGGIVFVETRKHKEPHDYHWSWSDIQRLDLKAEEIKITTYKDAKWLAGKDQRFVFKGKDLERAYPMFRERLPRRFVPEVAETTGLAHVAEIPAKRLEGRGGSEGMLLIGEDRLVFRSNSREGSHTWIVGEVENISSSDPLELTVSSLGSDYRLQLKQPLPEPVYRDLWRKLNLRSTH